jgi:four helix bundle protein
MHASSSMHPYRKLGVFHKAQDLTVRCYRITAEAAWRRDNFLVAQLRRVSLAIVSAIAFGSGLESPTQFARVLADAIAHARELDQLLLISKELNLLNLQTHAQLEARAAEIVKMLVALRKTVRRRSGNGKSERGVRSKLVPQP